MVNNEKGEVQNGSSSYGG